VQLQNQYQYQCRYGDQRIEREVQTNYTKENKPRDTAQCPSITFLFFLFFTSSVEGLMSTDCFFLFLDFLTKFSETASRCCSLAESMNVHMTQNDYQQLDRLSQRLSQQDLTSHSTHNLSFWRIVFPDNW